MDSQVSGAHTNNNKRVVYKMHTVPAGNAVSAGATTGLKAYQGLYLAHA